MATPDGNKCTHLIRSIIILVLYIISWHYSLSLVSRVRPTLYLNDIHVSETNNATIYFDLMIKNTNNLVGLYYEDPLTLTFSYFPQTITTNPKVTVAKYPIQAFYQGNGKVKHVQHSIVVQDFFPLGKDLGREDEETNGSWIGPVKVVDLRVDFDGKLKFKSIENKKADLVAGVTVEIDSKTGNIVQNKTIELKYASGSDKWGFLQWVMFFCLLHLFGLISSAIFTWHLPSLIFSILF